MAGSGKQRRTVVEESETAFVSTVPLTLQSGVELR